MPKILENEWTSTCRNKKGRIPAYETQLFIATRKHFQTTFILVNFFTNSFVL
jgi:hypothetical protein